MCVSVIFQLCFRYVMYVLEFINCIVVHIMCIVEFINCVVVCIKCIVGSINVLYCIWFGQESYPPYIQFGLHVSRKPDKPLYNLTVSISKPDSYVRCDVWHRSYLKHPILCKNINGKLISDHIL